VLLALLRWQLGTARKAYSLGAPQSSFTAIFNPLYIVYGVLFGLIIWHEKLNIYQVAGMGLSILGILLMVYFKK
jgi:drug/metabolite transporter (DMT)-like permease